MQVLGLLLPTQGHKNYALMTRLASSAGSADFCFANIFAITTVEVFTCNPRQGAVLYPTALGPSAELSHQHLPTYWKWFTLRQYSGTVALVNRGL
ncbi:hypothetical protein RR48_05336 [Papilio machaon]|uniref:Uncharacterized protein n=1 Tax=Papilio machaon TaxID=76193 RepID=A0A0N0PD97_PAPMA|nr:hypothetical protein RR48_05336 [Papilio machaon]